MFGGQPPAFSSQPTSVGGQARAVAVSDVMGQMKELDVLGIEKSGHAGPIEPLHRGQPGSLTTPPFPQNING